MAGNIKIEPKYEFKPKFYDVVRTFPDIKVISDNSKTVKYDGFIGDEQTALALVLQWVVARKPVLLGGPASSGKTNLLEVAATYCRKPYEFRAGTEKAEIYNSENEKAQEDISKATHFKISEINRVTDTVREMLKYFGEGDDYTYRRTGDEDITIKCTGFCTCLADENQVSVGKLGTELMSRLLTLTLDGTTNQTRKVIEATFKKKRDPFAFRKVNEDFIKKCQNYVKQLPDINKYTIIMPAGEIMADAVPYFFTSNRRDAHKWLMNVDAISMFHFPDRVKFDYRKKKILIASPVDMWYNTMIFGDMLKDSALKCDKLQKVMMDILDQYAREVGPDGDAYMQADRILKVLRERGYFPSIKVIEKKMDDMYDNGYVNKEEYARKARYKTSDALEAFAKSFDWETVARRCYENFENDWSDRLKERQDVIVAYKKQCENFEAVHPFTGETLDIRTWEKPKPKAETRKITKKGDLTDWQAPPSKEDDNEHPSYDSMEDITEEVV